MLVAQVVGRTLAGCGVRDVFGVVGSGNFRVTNALLAAGARFVAAAHEGGAASMADAYARVSGQVGVLTVHQGPGVTNALTGITEAAKSNTPLVILAPEATAPRSNFFIDLPAAAQAVGAAFLRVPATGAAETTEAAFALARSGRTVVLGLPLDVQAAQATPGTVGASALAHLSAADTERFNAAPAAVTARSGVAPGPDPDRSGVAPGPDPDRLGRPPGPDPDRSGIAPGSDVDRLVDAIRVARRPVFIAGRGAARDGDAGRAALGRLADRCGALLAVSAAAKGLFAGDPWDLDVSGGFATPLAAELIASADLIVAWGSTLNMWTTRHGKLIPPTATVAQVDVDPTALGVNRPVDIGVVGPVAAVADAVAREVPEAPGWRDDTLRDRIAAERRWQDVPYDDDAPPGTIDPRTLTIALDNLLPADRTVVVDSGNFMGYPSMFLSVPDVHGFCFTQAFQSIGLGLASAVGAAVARPDRLTVSALGDGGFLMAVAELTTAVRLGLPLVVVVYNDRAYGAEVHHFGPDGHPLDTVTFPDTDVAAIGRGFGCAGVTVRSVDDLDSVPAWLADPGGRPLVVDAKVSAVRGSWWLEEAFRGH